MYKIAITENTYHFLEHNSFYLFVAEMEELECKKNDKEFIISFEENENNIEDIYDIISLIYRENPDENNRWIVNGEEAKISDEQILKLLLCRFEKSDRYPLNRYILSDIIKQNKIQSIKELGKLTQQPFSGVFALDQFDIDMWRMGGQIENLKYIEIEDRDVCIKNRYIAADLKFEKGKIDICNCIIEGNVEIGSSAKIQFSQCIIMGKMTCTNVSAAYFSSVNVKQLMLYNSDLDVLRIEYCKIYRFIFHSCSLNKQSWFLNEFVEPYIAKIDEIKGKIDMSQFDAKNINRRMIKQINAEMPVKIKNVEDFYLTFMCKKRQASVPPDEITLDMVNIVLKHGDLKENHNLYSNMKYKKVLYSNNGWRRLFVILTGGFYIPSRWIMYLLMSTVCFAAIYSSFPIVQFLNTITQKMERLDLWTSVYYSVLRIINADATVYTPVGVSQICTTIQSLLNTMFIANFFAAVIRKYMRDEI